jgi:hypothetical protein
MDEATQKLMRHLPGELLSELEPAAPIVISEAFDLSSFEPTPVFTIDISRTADSKLMHSWPKIARYNRGPEHRNARGDLNSLKALREMPVAVRRLNHPNETATIALAGLT